jgi:hypothetical protein
VAFARAASMASASRLPSPAAGRRLLGQPAARPRQARLVAFGAQPAELVELLGAHGPVVDLEHVDVVVAGDRYLLTPMTGCRPESIRAWVRAAASSMRILGMPSSMAGPCRRRLDLGDVGPAPAGQLVGQPLDVVAAAPGVDHPAGARLSCCRNSWVLRRSGPRSRSAARAPRPGRWCAGLGVALGRGHRLDAGAGDVVEHVLRGQRPAEVWQWVRSDSDLALFGSNC